MVEGKGEEAVIRGNVLRYAQGSSPISVLNRAHASHSVESLGIGAMVSQLPPAPALCDHRAVQQRVQMVIVQWADAAGSLAEVVERSEVEGEEVEAGNVVVKGR